MKKAQNSAKWKKDRILWNGKLAERCEIKKGQNSLWHKKGTELCEMKTDLHSLQSGLYGVLVPAGVHHCRHFVFHVSEPRLALVKGRDVGLVI